VVPSRIPEAYEVPNKTLDGVDPSYERVVAVRGAAEIGEPARALLVKASKSPDAEVRIIAMRTLRTFAVKPPESPR
jgi:hypothetical protein